MLFWMNGISKKLVEWCITACKSDKWEEFDVDCPYSSSVIDIFQAIFPPLKIIKEFLFLQHENNFYQVYGAV